MKRISKKLSKSGFTLLEVLLATVILTIASTMIMKGFVAVMIFANNNKGFVKQSEANYTAALRDFMINYAVGNQADTIASINANDSTRTHHDTIAVEVANVSGVTIDGIYVVSEAYTEQGGLTNWTGALYPSGVVGSNISSATYASNRYAFFYDFGDAYYCKASGGESHRVRYGYVYNRTRDGNVFGYNYGFYCFEPTCPNYLDGVELSRYSIPVPTPAGS